MAVAFLINSVLSQDLPNLAIFAMVFAALIWFCQYFEYLRIEELVSTNSPAEKPLAWIMGGVVVRPRCWLGTWDHVRPGVEWRGETVFMTPDPVQRTVCSAALSPHYTLHTPPGGCSWQQTSVWSVYTVSLEFIATQFYRNLQFCPDPCVLTCLMTLTRT